MDNIDKALLNFLQDDATLSIEELAERVNLTTTPCWKRIKRLEDEGVIKSRVALVDSAKVELGVSVFVHIKTQHHEIKWLRKFSDAINDFDEVVECYRMAGEWDYLLRVVVKDIEAFDLFYKKLVNKVGGLSNVTSSFSMEEIKYTTKLSI